MPLAGFDPLVAEWFERRFGAPTEPQRLGWPEIRAGHDVLITAPTGSGKTLAAFLVCLDALIRQARAGSLADETHAVYVSPLRALSTDIRRNLEEPLSELQELAAIRGSALPPLRVALRTGDTPSWERRRMLTAPPHILVTTPESLFIFLTAETSRRLLASTRTVIVDEIHAVAGSKRGSHLSLSLERLDALVGATGKARPQRIGLSATVTPVEEVARFLSPEARIVTAGPRRILDVAVEVTDDELGAVATNEMWERIYDRLAALIQEHRATLIFVNTRRLCERVAHHVGERVGHEAVLPHHGSLSRRLRQSAEERLKRGQLRAVVATSSLELGIDVGYVDLVCQVGSPRSIAAAVQRIGRSGHWTGGTPKGRLFATTRDELIECAALVRAIRCGRLDRIEIPRSPLDVLAQQIVAECTCRDWSEDELFSLVRRAWPYRELERRDFDAVVTMLAEGIATNRGRSAAYLHRDQVHGRLRARRGARLAAITSGGAIPDRANYLVVAEPDGTLVGDVDEDFAVESLAGDIFLLGTTSWRIRRVEAGKVRVEDAQGAPPSIPFWRGEAPGRTRELSEEVAWLREELARRDPQEARELLERQCGLDARAAVQAVAYIRAGAAVLGAVPSTRTVVAERFFDESGGMQLVLHAPFGARVNRAWGLALRKRFCRSFNLELQAAATDNGIVISLSDRHSFPLDSIFGFVKPQTAEYVLTQALLASPMFTVRWRWNASRALAVLRFAGGRKVPPPIQRMRSDDLLAAVFPDQAACAENLTGDIRIPDHPLVKETIQDCLHEAMDLDGFREVLAAIERGEIRTRAVETAEPSVFSHEILNANPYAFLDDAPLEERRTRAVQLRRTLPEDLAAAEGALDPEIIAQVAADASPAVRDAEELHDALLTLVVLPPQEEWVPFFEELRRQSRAAWLHTGRVTLWVAAERLSLAQQVWPGAVAEPELPRILCPLPESREEGAAIVLRGWFECSGPLRASEIAARLAMPEDLVAQALARLEGSGLILRGRFTGRAEEVEWCDRRILARMHRLTLGKLRREIEPVSAADYMRFLLRWQHVAPDTRLHRAAGVLEVVRQLQGFEIPAAFWETQVLPARVAQYNPEFLDKLCLSGQVMWGRLSGHPAFEADPTAGRRVRPTRAAPVSLFLREEAEFLLGPRAIRREALSHAARDVLESLERRGASFFVELQRATGRLASEVEDALWELVAAGLVTGDGFENLRALLDPKRRRGQGRGRSLRPRHAGGRWALLHADRAQPTAEFFARQLLRRWGVVLRELLARETLAPPWRDLLAAFRRLEARGEIRGGRFVEGFLGEQFALPEAVEALRSVRRTAKNGEVITVSAADPLNLVGIVLPGPRLLPLSGQRIRLRDGVPVAMETPSSLALAAH
ncbi:MAG: DEAD/DEAH box helicase [Bryobacterales bacterium]|nr:DEAD/DEAH box helicase [Bryobacteraceae bacterium]MDW8353326.1 DEAD/DEAH box helicase [Bryobacterales bacterium]